MMCEEAGVSCNVHWHMESCCAPDTFQWVRQGRQPRPWKATLPTIEHIHHNETAKFSEFEHLWSPIPQETVSSWPAGPAAGILPSTQAESPDRDAAIPGRIATPVCGSVDTYRYTCTRNGKAMHVQVETK